MNKTKAKKRIEELRKETAYHAKKYYDDLERLKNKEQQVVSIETNKNVSII